mgnify:CR=1 FL=1
MISYGKQSIDSKDIKAIVKILRSPFLTQGPAVEEFEKNLAKKVGAEYCVSFSNGTAALFAACEAIGIKKGDEVIVPTLSFVASANCVVYCNGKPVLVDVNKDDNTINLPQVIKKVTSKTRAIIGVDFAGHVCDWDELKKISKKYNLFLIADSSHALGSKYKKKFVGSVADLTVFSFHPVKTITTGEGGAVTTNSKSFYEKMLRFKNHGIVKSAKVQREKGQWFYDVQTLGFNFRLTDIQAALGISQLKKLNSFIKKRRSLWLRYNELFSKYDFFQLPVERPWNYSAWHLYTLRLKPPFDKLRKKIFSEFLKNGIKLQVHYIPIHRHTYYKKSLGYRNSDFPDAEKYYSEEISLPLFPDLTDFQQKKVSELLINTINENG